MDESPIATLHEVLYDGLIFSPADKAFVYAEVELAHTACKLKNSAKERLHMPRAPSGTLGFTTEMQGLSKDKWDDYTMILTTVHLGTLGPNTLSVPLHTLLKTAIKTESSAFAILSYERLRELSARFALDVVSKLAKTKAAEREGDTRRSRGSEPRDDSVGFARPSALNTSRANRNASILNQSMSWRKGENGRENAVFYEEMIQVEPMVMARVTICPETEQVLLRVTNLSNNVKSEPPVSFQEAARKCSVPIKLLSRATPWVGGRLLNAYRDAMLRQYFGQNIGGKESARVMPKIEDQHKKSGET